MEKYENFEDYLITLHAVYNNTMTPEELANSYPDFVANIEPDEFIKIAQRYGNIKIMEGYDRAIQELKNIQEVSEDLMEAL
jgi:hypothetical protein